MNRRCVPRARGMASLRGVSPASPELSRTTITSSPGSSCGTRLANVRRTLGRPLVPTMIEKVAMRAGEDAIAGVAQLLRERSAHACDDLGLLVGHLRQVGVGEERVPLPVAGQRREREAVAG